MRLQALVTSDIPGLSTSIADENHVDRSFFEDTGKFLLAVFVDCK